jgi:SNF2 family DNA or RNA helicase
MDGGYVEGCGESAPRMWNHQQEAVDFARDRAATLWHMGMGTGKSRCAVQVADEHKAKKILILCPLSVIPAWEKQFRLFGERGYEICLLRKGGVKGKSKKLKEALSRAKHNAWPLVVVVNFESARCAPLSDMLMKEGWDLLIMDEIHRIKSPAGKASRWVSRLAKLVKKKIGLSGTIMPHSTMDVYAQFRSLDPMIFGWSFVKFRKRYAKMGGWGGKQIVGDQNIDELRAKMATITYQADRGVLDLPDAIHHTIDVDLSKAATRIYKDLSDNLTAEIKDGTVVASNALVKLLRLQQLTSGVATVDGDPPVVVRVDESKRDALSDIIENLPVDEPLVAFGVFRADLDTIHEAAAKAKRGSLELSGRRKELEAWQAGEAPILAVQIKAGGVGIDLTKAGGKPCSYCVFLSTGFNLGDYEQALARIHRPGAERTVFYYHLLAENTVDVQVFHALRARKDAVEAVLENLAGAESPEPQINRR